MACYLIPGTAPNFRPVRLLLTNPDLRKKLGANALLTAQKEFNPQTIVRTLVEGLGGKISIGHDGL